MIKLIYATLVGTFCAACAAAQVPEHLKVTRTIDFSEPHGMAYSQHGYRLTAPENNWIRVSSGGGITATNGSDRISIGSTGAPVTISQADHTAFDLIAMDVAEYSTVAIPDYVDFVGEKLDGSTINYRFVPDMIIDGDGSQEDFETVNFPPSWTDLVAVKIITSKVSIDNIQLRGLGLPSFHASNPNTPQLSVVGLIGNYAYNISWGIRGLENGEMKLWHQRFSSEPFYQMLFDMNSGLVIGTGSTSSTSGTSDDFSESAYVSNGKLIWTDGIQNIELAHIGQDNVSSISYPAPGDGKVLFVNHWYLGEEQYAVFIADSNGVTPVITPDTILPGGDRPYSFPREIFFTGKSYAVSTSTSSTSSLYLISFDGGPILLSPAAGDAIPGTSLTVKGRPKLKYLDDISARFTAESEGGNGELLEIVMSNDGSWIAYATETPALSSKTSLPGYGLLQRHYGSIPFERGNTQITHGSIECFDLHPNNLNGLVVQRLERSPQLMIWVGQTVRGFGVISHANKEAWVEGGLFYVVARNTEGSVALLSGPIPESSPTPYSDQFVSMADGSVRFMINNLTHGKNYLVERSDSPAGPWFPASSFTAGSPARSVLGNYSYGNREFYRVSEKNVLGSRQ